MWSSIPEYVRKQIDQDNRERIERGKLVPGHERWPLSQREREFLKNKPPVPAYSPEQVEFLARKVLKRTP